MTREQMYNDVVKAKEIICQINYDFEPEPAELLHKVFRADLTIREKVAYLTVLYAGRWQTGWYGTSFMMPATWYCLEQYQNVKKNLGKEMKFTKYHYEEDEPEWEGFIELSFRNYREKKTA